MGAQPSHRRSAHPNRESRFVAPDETRACRGCGHPATPALLTPELALSPLEQGHPLLSDFSRASAWVCPNCGLVEFYVDRPEYFRRPVRPLRPPPT
jgi:hypothetical protein